MSFASVDTSPRRLCRLCLPQNPALLAALRLGHSAPRLVMSQADSAVVRLPCRIAFLRHGQLSLQGTLSSGPISHLLLKIIVSEKLLIQDSRPHWHSSKPLGPTEDTRRSLLGSRTVASLPTVCSDRLAPACETPNLVIFCQAGDSTQGLLPDVPQCPVLFPLPLKDFYTYLFFKKPLNYASLWGYVYMDSGACGSHMRVPGPLGRELQ